MKLSHGLHLAYCTNIHRGEDWSETFDALRLHTLSVRDRVCPGEPYAIGLRLSDCASRQLADPATLREFQRWLDRENCYVFTINGFPFGAFHGQRVKEQVYAPDWSTDDRLGYTNRLFDLLAELVPPGIEGSVSTMPAGTLKELFDCPDRRTAMRANLWRCIEHIAALSERSGKTLHLGLEPEPLCLLETSAETVAFIEEMRADRPKDERIDRHLGVNYDACHLAVEFEDPRAAIDCFRQANIRISKLHLSSALSVRPTLEAKKALSAFADDTYLHQVIARDGKGSLSRYRDLDVALREPADLEDAEAAEWRVHFHIPLHSAPTALFGNTADHLLGVLDVLKDQPGLCSHLEMETYTWEVMPSSIKNRSVVAQLISEYAWTLARLSERGLYQGCAISR